DRQAKPAKTAHDENTQLDASRRWAEETSPERPPRWRHETVSAPEALNACILPRPGTSSRDFQARRRGAAAMQARCLCSMPPRAVTRRGTLGVVVTLRVTTHHADRDGYTGPVPVPVPVKVKLRLTDGLLDQAHDLIAEVHDQLVTAGNRGGAIGLLPEALVGGDAGGMVLGLQVLHFPRRERGRFRRSQLLLTQSAQDLAQARFGGARAGRIVDRGQNVRRPLQAPNAVAYDLLGLRFPTAREG